MVVLRATQKVLRRLSGVVASDHASDTALGDWYVNRIVVDRKPLLLLVSSKSLLAVLTHARDLRTLPERLPQIVSERLGRMHVAAELIELELGAMDLVEVGRTRDRSVLGSMVEFGKLIPYLLTRDRWGMASLPVVEARLSETPCRLAGKFEDMIFPNEEARRLLEKKWVG